VSAITDFNCTYSLYLSGGSYSQQYGSYNGNIYHLNAVFSKQICTEFSSLQCCAANDVTMLEQSIGQILPPCLYNYFNTNCTAVNFQSNIYMITILFLFAVKGSLNTSPYGCNA